MNVLVLNGNPFNDKGNIDQYIGSLVEELKSAGHNTTVIVLRDLKISPCTGCFNCWLKTAGTCTIRDDARDVTRQYIAAEHVIFASPLIMGFPSALLKTPWTGIFPSCILIWRKWTERFITRSVMIVIPSFHIFWRKRAVPMKRTLPFLLISFAGRPLM